MDLASTFIADFMIIMIMLLVASAIVCAARLIRRRGAPEKQEPVVVDLELVKRATSPFVLEAKRLRGRILSGQLHILIDRAELDLLLKMAESLEPPVIPERCEGKTALGDRCELVKDHCGGHHRWGTKRAEAIPTNEG